MAHTPVKSISLYADRELELWEEAEAIARTDEDQREAQVLAAILLEYLEGGECDHLDSYKEVVDGEEFCMRCRDEGRTDREEATAGYENPNR